MVPFYAGRRGPRRGRGRPRAPATELALAQRAPTARRLVWDERRLTIAFPILLDDEVYAVVTITSAPPLYRFDLIQSMAAQVAQQLARVAERERAQAELAEARDEAMEASRQKSEFLATMSHEIRTPLNGVIGLNDLLLRTALDARAAPAVAGVQVASRALLGLINDILDFSKIEAGKLELERVDFEVRPVLDEVADVLAEPARDKGLELAVSCRPGRPGGADRRPDPARAGGDQPGVERRQVHRATAAVAIRADGRARPRTGVPLLVEVTDTGRRHQPRAQLAHLFDPFTQADSSTTRQLRRHRPRAWRSRASSCTRWAADRVRREARRGQHLHVHRRARQRDDRRASGSGRRQARAAAPRPPGPGGRRQRDAPAVLGEQLALVGRRTSGHERPRLEAARHRRGDPYDVALLDRGCCPHSDGLALARRCAPAGAGDGPAAADDIVEPSPRRCARPASPTC